MALSSLVEFVILVVKNPCYQQDDASSSIQEISISASEIASWDMSEILSYGSVKVRAHRTRLIQESSYFHGLLSGSFSESGLDHISVEWNLESFLNLLMCLYGYDIEITSSSFLPLFESALYFGVEKLLSICKNWLSVLASSNDNALPKVELSDLIQIWSFGLEHAGEFVPDLCVAYLAKNFMLVKSDKYFGNVPYELLMWCVKHPHLTVHSEMDLVDGLLIWLDAGGRLSDLPESSQDNTINLMEQVRFSLLPLWFIAGRSKSHGFSKFADQSIELVTKLMKMPSTCLVDSLTDGPPTDVRVRLTEYSEILDLSGCPQLNEASLLLSILPNSYFANLRWRKSLESFLKNPDDDERHQEQISHRTLPILSFESVKEIDISKCQRLDYKVVIKCFSKSFPSLRKLRAAYLLNIKVSTLLELLLNFRELTEVDLTVDVSPIIPVQASVFYSGQGHCLLSSITRLTLEGRSDICDMELRSISRVCESLCYLNIKGCALLSDACIASVIQRCKKLCSLIVCYTSFSENSILALCATISMTNEHMDINSVASNLQTLHMSKCEGISETSLLNLITHSQKMKSLCLRDTKVSDSVLCEFPGSTLEALDISNTTISWMALARVISRNPNLKTLKARGCKNLLQLEVDGRTDNFSPLVSGQEVFKCLSKGSGLEELEIGWGFSYFSFESLRPAASFLRVISVGLGASLGEDVLKLLPSTCPLLESIVLHFQEISDSALTSVLTSLKHLQELALSYCFGEISLQSFKFSMPNLRKLRLERVTRWMTNDDLLVLTQSCPNLTELSLVGCLHLTSDCQPIISAGWPGMISLHLEECGSITENGVASLYGCIALEDLFLRHNGSGIQKSFLLDATLKFPMLRLVSLDMCDAKEGGFDVPEEKEEGRSLSIVKISRCKSDRCSLGRRAAPMHRETLVMLWNGQTLTKTLLKQRL
ncbi:ubiquitin-protein ligase [Arabidopsis thaliana]|uniref:BTB/POZ domain-containing protein FBL11 n=1 Tax=Arabidopsis thaliana TaxID=3702 RepID=FBL11_ARATH|nr:ubiquitin-protein ligase [Arabidopsis thaliana]Q8S8F2.2 RecName: Full=BTB/POZ domain-containing protein FBL11 [Arabidopsis thaliana]AEC09245.2 ubiquitin-protein ligase [Arabidopsis thaliana]|eukprot:NP_565845.3 ubiquitin-protein ligase [Arabidopsis thaliana]